MDTTEQELVNQFAAGLTDEVCTLIEHTLAESDWPTNDGLNLRIMRRFASDLQDRVAQIVDEFESEAGMDLAHRIAVAQRTYYDSIIKDGEGFEPDVLRLAQSMADETMIDTGPIPSWLK